MAERGAITLLGAGVTTVVGRLTGSWPKAITLLINWVIVVGFDNGRSRCWGLFFCIWFGSDWGVRQKLVVGIVWGKDRGHNCNPRRK